MKLWIMKEDDLAPHDEWVESYVFTLNRDTSSTIYTNIAETWYHMDQMQLSPVYEDLFVIGLSVFAVDKRVRRNLFQDCWTRELEVNIPVLEYEKWVNTVDQWEKTLSFLTGDNWHIHFRETDMVYSLRKHKSRIHLDIQGCDCVSLFSGGLDSFCGAIKLLKNGKSPCLIGHNEYPGLKGRQDGFAESLQNEYPNQKVEFMSFTGNSRTPSNSKGENLGVPENTSRGRSLLFLCAALSIAGILGNEVPVYIPENGFIGLNLPLTESRRGTCSTRTTHPYFLRMFKKILRDVDIKNEIINFFAYSTKREIVNAVKDTTSFRHCFKDTISCSHPCQPRWEKKEYPKNCGYCYPCLIRKSCLLDVEKNIDGYSHDDGHTYTFLNDEEKDNKLLDLRAVLTAVYRSKHITDEELISRIKHTGKLLPEEVDKFVRVYRSTMEDLTELFAQDEKLHAYIGI